AHIPVVERPDAVAALLREPPAGPASAPSGYERGLAVRRAVLGEAHVARALAQATPFDADFQRFVTEHVWGSVWTRPGLDRRTRSLLTIGLLAALGHHEELRLHLRATRRTGVTADEVKEVLLHTAVYAGVPASHGAFRVAREVYQALEQEERS
ncbi:MAG TPA: 4-carboxymuconolactone decarboxylase, partial [Thermodesulfobacteriota bacterium]|nr:4-carboxymuconolactone decarboxylase [Thermodesulfobacteriota bacterium]